MAHSRPVAKNAPEHFPLYRRLMLAFPSIGKRSCQMHGLIYLIGLIVVIMAILSFFGLR
jgi:hypothetical protein